MWNLHVLNHRYCLLLIVVAMTATSRTSFFCNGFTTTNNRSTNCHRYRKILTLLNTVPVNFNDERRCLTICDESSVMATKPRRPESTTTSKDMYQSVITALVVACFVLISCAFQAVPANAAPPFAVIAEELGYYPIMVPSSSSSGSQSSTVQYVAKRVQRPSTQQAIDLAHFMRTAPDQQIVLAGTYWCSHTSHQKELFGIEAWNELNTKDPSSTTSNKRDGSGRVRNKSGFTYIECAPQGYRSNPTICSNLKIDGYPTWIITTKSNTKDSKPNTLRLSGERSLYDIANAVGYTNTFDASIEDASNPPPGMGSLACK
jgi:hypothetical protein